MLELLFDKQGIHDMRELWEKWNTRQAEFLQALNDHAFREIASRLGDLREFIVKCSAYYEVADFLERRILSCNCKRASTDERLAIAEIHCFVAQMWNRCNELEKSEMHLRYALRWGKQLPANSVLIDAWAHLSQLLFKQATPRSIREAKDIQEGRVGEKRLSDASLISQLQMNAQTGSHKSVLRAFTDYLQKGECKYISTVYAVVGNSYFQRACKARKDYDESREYGEDALRFAIRSRIPREILLRSLDLERSWEPDDIHRAAELLSFARAFTFAAVGLDKGYQQRLHHCGVGLRDGVRRSEITLNNIKKPKDKYRYVLGLSNSRPNRPLFQVNPV